MAQTPDFETYSMDRHGWSDIVGAATLFRRDLHRRPELTWQEQQTAATIRRTLDRLGIAWTACADTGTIARLAREATGRHVALRGDIDALPITEATTVDWISQTPGCMHACGHDGHTATLMAAACWLKRHEADLPGPVTLLFQPAEEGGFGAKRMIEDGALQGVDVIYGWHNWPAIPFGQAVCPDGPVMAGNGTFRIKVIGAGGHSSQPELSRDPILAASAITLSMQQVVSRRLPPQHAAVLSITSIDGKSGDTVVRDDVTIGGSIRIGNSADRTVINRLITEIATGIGTSYGVDVEVEHFSRYDATVNHAAPAADARACIAEVLGPSWQATQTPVPIMASEDFSFYLDAIPGAFMLVGADDGNGHHEPCHSPRYDFNDRLIPEVVQIFARLARAPLP